MFIRYLLGAGSSGGGVSGENIISVEGVFQGSLGAGQFLCLKLSSLASSAS